VIVHEELLLAVPTALVQRRLTDYLRGDGLQAASAAAFGDGEQILLRVGFAGLNKQVAVQTLPAYRRERTVVVPLRWIATGATGDAFPTLDANLELDETAEHGTTLALTGSYTPPLGRLGATVDHVLLNRAAQATARSFLTRLEHVLQIPGEADTEARDLRAPVEAPDR
jgi:hypothetical protein